jgi:polysaccharide export outer membrane protein
MNARPRTANFVETGAGLALVTAISFWPLCASAATQPGYRINPGDLLNVEVYGEQRDASAPPTVVAPDGSIRYPIAGRVQVAGLTGDEAQQAIQRKLSLYYKHPVVSVDVTQGAMDVLVLGNVRSPGKYSLKTGEHVAGAIAAAGGLGPTDGDYPDARISVGSQLVQTVSLQSLLHDGDVSANAPLPNGSVVYVSERTTFKVRIIGAVDHPGDVEIKDGDRLTSAIALAGNSKGAQADLNRIVITRPLVDGTSQKLSVDLYQELEQGDIDADPVLQKGDIVFVPEVKSHSSGAQGILSGLRRFVFPWWY